MDDDLHSAVRVAAAKAGKSMSRHIADTLSASIDRPSAATPVDRKAQMEALERLLSGPKWNVMRDGRMPTADERNER
jgi:plasmid stability protein